MQRTKTVVSFTSVLCYFEILMEEVELLVAERYKFEYRAKSIKAALFQNVRTVETLMQVTQIDNSSIENHSETKTFLVPSLMKIKKPVVLRNMKLNIEKS